MISQMLKICSVVVQQKYFVLNHNVQLQLFCQSLGRVNSSSSYATPINLSLIGTVNVVSQFFKGKGDFYTNEKSLNTPSSYNFL